MLSIVIPIYNGEKYIPDIMAAFKAQPIMDYELIFVDDGSTDNSLNALNSATLAMKDCGISVSVIHQDNAGVSAARNAGILACKGEYVTFVDVDDKLASNYLKAIFEGIKNNPDLFVFQSLHVSEDELLGAEAFSGYVNRNMSNTDMIELMLSNPTNFGVYNLVINKKFLDKSKVLFPLGYKYYEDYFFIYSLFCYTKNIVFTENQLYFYIKRPGSAMQKFTKDRIKCLELIESLYPLVEKSVPSILMDFESLAVARIYWSVLWQAALAFNYHDFKKFCKSTNAKKRINGLATFPDRKVKLSSKLFGCYPRVYYCAVRFIGKSHSKVQKVKYSDFTKV